MSFNSTKLTSLFATMNKCVAQNQKLLIELDSICGDGDLGLSMCDGFSAVTQALEESVEKDIGKLLFIAGKTFNKRASSTTGTLFSNGLITSAKALRGRIELNLDGLATMIEGWLEGIMTLGCGKRGEKTIIDALAPAADVLRQAAQTGTSIPEAMEQAAKAAVAGAESTRNMLAVHGRAAVRSTASIGMIDPGAVLFGILITAMANDLKENQC